MKKKSEPRTSIKMSDMTDVTKDNFAAMFDGILPNKKFTPDDFDAMFDAFKSENYKLKCYRDDETQDIVFFRLNQSTNKYAFMSVDEMVDKACSIVDAQIDKESNLVMKSTSRRECQAHLINITNLNKEAERLHHAYQQTNMYAYIMRLVGGDDLVAKRVAHNKSFEAAVNSPQKLQQLMHQKSKVRK